MTTRFRDAWLERRQSSSGYVIRLTHRSSEMIHFLRYAIDPDAEGMDPEHAGVGSFARRSRFRAALSRNVLFIERSLREMRTANIVVQTVAVILCCLLLNTALSQRQTNDKIDWPAYQDMAVDLMRQYLRIKYSTHRQRDRSRQILQKHFRSLWN